MSSAVVSRPAGVMPRQVLAVLDGPRERVVVVDLPGEPEGFADLAPLAALAVADGAPPCAPAGPPLVADGLVVHRVRAEVADEPAVAETAPRSAQLEALLTRALDEENGRRPVPVERAPWCRPGWAADTRAWVQDVVLGSGLRPAGPSVVVRSWPLSHVERFPTSGGDLYLKAACELFAHEPVVTQWLSRAFPGDVPDVLATDASRGCMLMRALPGLPRDPSVRGVVPEPEVLVRTAETTARLQLESVGRVDELRAVGAPVRSLARTREDFVHVVHGGTEIERLDARELQRLRAALPWVLEQVEALEECALPDTLVHGDLHPGNVAAAPQALVVYDWTDACIAHPFLDVIHLGGAPAYDTTRLDPTLPWVQAYLEPWRQGYDEAVLTHALRLAAVAERVFQAVSYEGIQRSLEPGARRDLAGVEAQILASIVSLVGTPS